MKRHLMGLALLVAAPLMAQAKPVTYEWEGKKYEGFMAKKDNRAPMVLLVHDWDGLNDYEKKRAEMLLKKGYSVFAPDLFGAGVRPSEDKDRKQHTGELYQDRAKMRALLTAALDAAKKNGLNTANAVAIGYCFGGAAVLEMARSGVDLKGFVTFHGGLETPEGQNYSTAKGKVLVFHGTADTAITMNHFSNLATELESSGIKHEMVAYGGAPHAFTVFGSDRYRKDADEASWTRFLAFMKEATGK